MARATIVIVLNHENSAKQLVILLLISWDLELTSETFISVEKLTLIGQSRIQKAGRE